MFERFTDRARRVVVVAQEEAANLGHTYIGTEHLLLGLIAEGAGVGCQALVESGVSLERLRLKIESVTGRGDTRPVGLIPFTPRAKKVMELSLREALQLGHNYIGTEHLLLALIREGEGLGATALTSLGLELSTVRQRVITILASFGLPKTQRNGAKMLDLVCDLLAMADGVTLGEVGQQWIKCDYEGAPYRVIVSPL